MAIYHIVSDLSALLFWTKTGYYNDEVYTNVRILLITYSD